MIKFRFHRGSLDDSMQAVIDISSKQDIADAVNKKWKLKKDLSGDDINVEYYCFDERINWDTYIVTFYGGVIGFCNRGLK